MAVGETAAALRAEARETNERRLLVLADETDDGREPADALDAAGTDDDATDRGLAAAADALDAAGVERAETTLVGHRDGLRCERVEPRDTGDLLGTTREAVVYDARDECRPNALGRITGAVDGGGLLVLVTPALDDWPARRDRFDDGMAVPPFDVGDVSGRFRARLVRTLRAHRGVGIVALDGVEDGEGDAGVTVVDDGLTHPAPRLPAPDPVVPDERAFPREAYAACLTTDQVEALGAFETLFDAGSAVVCEADRGRGKTSAAGLAAGSLAVEGRDVLVTAPSFRGVRDLYARASELFDALGVAFERPETTRLDLPTGGTIRYAKPPAAADELDDCDALLVDEAAALPVRLLERYLDADAVAFTTTVHGYEGAGRGFDVRFRDVLADTDRDVTDVRLDEPIRYAAGDPVEVWAFRALLLDARPPVEPLVADADPETCTYDALDGDALAADETLLREAFGLLVAAHYRTEPDDLARLLDAPNLDARALRRDGHVVAVALLAREGGLDEETRDAMYTGERVKGNMLPDVLTSQLRDPDAADPVGTRVVRIATHHAARSRGLGSALLDGVRAEFGCRDWLGVGYGATPALLSFWARNGFSTVHLSTTRNDASGEYSALMLDPLSDAGGALADRHESWFADRIAGVLADALDDCDPDVARAALAACDATPAPDLSDDAWRVVAGSAYGSAMYSVDPEPFRRLAVCALVRDDAPGLLSDADAVEGDPETERERRERLLVRKLLQCHSWDAVADELGYHSAGQAMRAFGDALKPLCEAWGGEAAAAERARHRGE
ncbi:tRNA(Met) cytidine acetyltransferase [Halarchaeum rubridurum]|uniref:tRNA(Met) cytidine acetyltransferase TmcA n=1 Tax=Halarchaeum rubridurum TaxID=489911 RepID=A0A830FZ75_9EURY|nr:tRNA(Met) cytidine acetyltransferase TmcA [Halarchaeum rubridurum]MBP1953229.1 tRNA(Met) cytidine acetyltransferase [Halarchaeum rubridurum]GGM66880.1 tRNA cytosine(34) acetyltransferase TmcA [Halarchaeum rubridurum]